MTAPVPDQVPVRRSKSHVLASKRRSRPRRSCTRPAGRRRRRRRSTRRGVRWPAGSPGGSGSTCRSRPRSSTAPGQGSCCRRRPRGDDEARDRVVEPEPRDVGRERSEGPSPSRCRPRGRRPTLGVTSDRDRHVGVDVVDELAKARRLPVGMHPGPGVRAHVERPRLGAASVRLPDEPRSSPPRGRRPSSSSRSAAGPGRPAPACRASTRADTWAPGRRQRPPAAGACPEGVRAEPSGMTWRPAWRSAWRRPPAGRGGPARLPDERDTHERHQRRREQAEGDPRQTARGRAPRRASARAGGRSTDSSHPHAPGTLDDPSG